MQRFHGEASMVYLCNEIKKYSCRSKEGWWSTKPVMEVRILPGVQNWNFGRLGVCDGLKIHRTWFNSTRLRDMVVVAQLARALDCGSGGRGFEPIHSPKREYSSVAERMAVNHRVVGSSHMAGITDGHRRRNIRPPAATARTLRGARCNGPPRAGR